MKIFGVYLILLAFPLLAQSKPYEEQEIIQIISKEKEKHNLKAVVFGVWQDNKLVASGALGDSMTGVPATKDMHFRIGGITETFLTTLLLQLVDAGKISLDDKLSKWLPELPNADLVSLKMLADSTSGYPDYEQSTDFQKAFIQDVFKEWTTKELLDYAFASPPQFKPGTEWRYSHTNYVILGDVLEKITQQPMQQLLQEKIFNKIGLKNTNISITPEIGCPVLHAYSTDRGIYEDSTYWSPSWTSFSGMMTSTIEDLGKWINAFGTGVLLSKESHKIQITPTSAKKDSASPSFGLGFAIINSWFVQNPRFGGYAGVFAYHPSKKLGIVIFNTLNPENSPETHYSQIIATELVKKLTPDALIEEKKTP